MRIFWQSVLAAVAASTLGCSGGDPVSIGKNDGTSETAAKTGEYLADYGGSWDGYIEGSRAWAGSDRLRFTLDDNGQGYIEFGDGAPLAPPTDPEELYPPDAEPGPTTTATGLHPGFQYTVRNARVESRRIRFDIEETELLKAWCELQTSYPNTTQSGLPEYNCLPAYPVGGHTDDGRCYLGQRNDPNAVEVNCRQLAICLQSRTCACDEAGCTSSGRTAQILDGVLENGGNDFEGTLLNSGTVRLTRQ